MRVIGARLAETLGRSFVVGNRPGGGAIVGILGGQVHMRIDAITTMAPNVRASKVKAMGTPGRTRSSVLPEVPRSPRRACPAASTESGSA